MIVKPKRGPTTTTSTSTAGDEVEDAEFFSRLGSVYSVNPSDGSLDVRSDSEKDYHVIHESTAINGQRPQFNGTVDTGYTVEQPINSDGTTTTAGSTTGNGTSQDDFLTLLVAELKNQDPDQPADTTAMMSQEAQFSELQRYSDHANNHDLMLEASQSTQAAGMIGKSITANDPNGGNPHNRRCHRNEVGHGWPDLIDWQHGSRFRAPITEVDASTTAS